MLLPGKLARDRQHGAGLVGLAPIHHRAFGHVRDPLSPRQPAIEDAGAPQDRCVGAGDGAEDGALAGPPERPLELGPPAGLQDVAVRMRGKERIPRTLRCDVGTGSSLLPAPHPDVLRFGKIGV